jgi:hypothetical protein
MTGSVISRSTGTWITATISRSGPRANSAQCPLGDSHRNIRHHVPNPPCPAPLTNFVKRNNGDRSVTVDKIRDNDAVVLRWQRALTGVFDPEQLLSWRCLRWS